MHDNSFTHVNNSDGSENNDDNDDSATVSSYHRKPITLFVCARARSACSVCVFAYVRTAFAHAASCHVPFGFELRVRSFCPHRLSVCVSACVCGSAFGVR